MTTRALSREEAVDRLRTGWVEGLLSLDTFEQRVAGAQRARTQGELVALLADVLLRPIATPLTRLRDALARPRGPALPVLLPGADQPPLLLGRHPDCDVVLDDPTVSRRHLTVRPTEDGWIARDFDSLNGSWLGEARLGRARVVPGDELVLGETLVRLG